MSRLMLQIAPLRGVSHQIAGPQTAPYRPGANVSTTFKALYANPAEEQGAIWMVVASADTMSQLTDYGVDRTDAELCETIDQGRQREVQHEIPNRDLGCCGLSCCEWLGGLFLSKRQGPSDRTVGVRSSSANLSHCDCRHALPSEHLFVSCCKCCHVCSGRSTGGNPAATIKPLEVIQRTSLSLFRLDVKLNIICVLADIIHKN